jgi:DNA-binding MarR family transcriptional regulator
MEALKNLFDYKDLQHLVWIDWYHSNRLVAIYSDKSLTKVRGIPYEQFMVLNLMKKLGKNANATEMGKYLNKGANTLTTILDRMGKKGLLKKTRDKRDRRLVWVVMTPKGREKLAATTTASLAVFQKLASCFSKEELEQFDALLEKLIINTNKLAHPPLRRKKPKLTWD